MLGQYPKTEKMQSPITLVLFECMVLLEVLRLAVKACVEQSGADQVVLTLIMYWGSYKPTIYCTKLGYYTNLFPSTHMHTHCILSNAETTCNPFNLLMSEICILLLEY